MGVHRKSDASFHFQPWVASSSTKSKASSFVTQSTCDTWWKWDVNIIQKRDRNNKQYHLISELNSVEFAGMFKQLRPDSSHKKGVCQRGWGCNLHLMVGVKKKKKKMPIKNLKVVVMNWAPSANSWIISATAWDLMFWLSTSSLNDCDTQQRVIVAHLFSVTFCVTVTVMSKKIFSPFCTLDQEPGRSRQTSRRGRGHISVQKRFTTWIEICT